MGSEMCIRDSTSKATFDQMVITFHKYNCQSCWKDYPTANFGTGVTNLSRISAAENMGVLFLFVVLSFNDEGWKFLSNALGKQAHDLSDVIQVIEAFLCFYTWLCLPQQWLLSQEKEAMESAQNSIRKLMELCVTKLPQADGNGWCVPKVLLNKSHPSSLNDSTTNRNSTPMFSAAEILLKFVTPVPKLAVG